MAATLLMPCAGLSTRYPGMRPKWLLTTPSGELAIERAVRSVPQSAWRDIVFAFRADHEAAYGCTALVRRLFGEAAKVAVLPRDTQGPADTVSEMIQAAGVSGPIIIKDCDSFFDPLPLPAGDFLGVVDLRAAPTIQSVGAKSFARINENDLVVEVVEKTVISNFISAGIYGFGSAAWFVEAFQRRRAQHGGGEIFASHIMNAGIVQGHAVRSAVVSNLIDVGTIADWRRYVQEAAAYVCDIDGVVFENQSLHFAPTWDEPETPIADNVALLLELERKGALLVFMTSRPERIRDKTVAALRAQGFKAETVIMGAPHSRRFMINDYAKTNPFPSAVGVSTPRNEPRLRDLLGEWLA
jgi:hypothetical protein